MKLILHTEDLKLNVEEHFPSIVDRYLEKYIDFLKNENIDSTIISNVKAFHNNIHTCLIEYYYGQHGSARFFFNRAMEHINISMLSSSIKEEILYRARAGKGETSKDLFTAEDMFHIPLEKRYLVSTERFSFPGLPCLYLGTSPEVCCEELENWNDNLSIAIVKKKKANINILDLSFFDKFDIFNLDNHLLKTIYELWPIVACCSFSYNIKSKMQFRPDYIIPQLLLEYIIDKNFDKSILGIENEIVGIRYRSVKKPFFDLTENRFDDRYINYVFPALSNDRYGHCSKLKEYFEITDVLKSKELMDIQSF